MRDREITLLLLVYGRNRTWQNSRNGRKLLIDSSWRVLADTESLKAYTLESTRNDFPHRLSNQTLSRPNFWSARKFTRQRRLFVTKTFRCSRLFLSHGFKKLSFSVSPFFACASFWKWKLRKSRKIQEIPRGERRQNSSLLEAKNWRVTFSKKNMTVFSYTVMKFRKFPKVFGNFRSWKHLKTFFQKNAENQFSTSDILHDGGKSRLSFPSSTLWQLAVPPSLLGMSRLAPLLETRDSVLEKKTRAWKNLNIAFRTIPFHAAACYYWKIQTTKKIYTDMFLTQGVMTAKWQQIVFPLLLYNLLLMSVIVAIVICTIK